MSREHARILRRARDGDTTAHEARQRLRDLNEEIEWDLTSLLPDTADGPDEKSGDDDRRMSKAESE
jgi:hypothetical protein